MSDAIIELRYMESTPNSLSGVQHVHDKSYEILFVIEGEGSMLIGNNLYTVSPNTVFLTSKMEVHNIMPTSEHYVRNILNVSDEYIDKLAELTSSSDYITELFQRRCIRLSDDVASLIKTQFSIIKSDAEATVSNGISKLSNLINLFELLTTSESIGVTSINSAVSDAVRYIDKNLSSALSLDEICDKVHLSKYHFIRIFREKTGMSPFKYIIESRISKAKKLLTYTDESISNIACSVVFSTSSNFCNLFQKYEKISPTEFRRIHKKITDHIEKKNNRPY